MKNRLTTASHRDTSSPSRRTAWRRVGVDSATNDPARELFPLANRKGCPEEESSLNGERRDANRGRRSGRRIAALGGSVLLVSVALGGSVAASAGPAPTTYSACVSHFGAVLYAVTASPATPSHCVGHDTSISWNQVGPAGPPGATGAQGPAGLHWPRTAGREGRSTTGGTTA